MIEIPLDPVSKPRMTRKDRFNPSQRTLKYWEYKDELNTVYSNQSEKCRELLWSPCKIIFVVPMPPSWTKKRRTALEGEPHIQTPDIDNLLKGFMDALFDQDDHVWSVWAEKVWGRQGKIIVRTLTI